MAVVAFGGFKLFRPRLRKDESVMYAERGEDVYLLCVVQRFFLSFFFFLFSPLHVVVVRSFVLFEML